MESLTEDNIICFKPVIDITTSYEKISNSINKKSILSMNDYNFNSKKSKIYINPNNDLCVICREKFTTINNSWICECNHVFHKSCLCKILYYKNEKNINCPLCRKNITMEYCLFTYGPFTHYYNIINNKKIDYIGLCDIMDMNYLANNITDMICLTECEECNGVLNIKNRNKCNNCYNFCYNYKEYNKKIKKKIKYDKKTLLNLHKNDIYIFNK